MAREIFALIAVQLAKLRGLHSRWIGKAVILPRPAVTQSDQSAERYVRPFKDL
jgi:hypothetical protein